MRNAWWKHGIEWLAAAATDPRACKREGNQGTGTALLTAGRSWDVLSVPEHLGLVALDIMWRARPGVPGPTLADCAAGRVGFFLPPDPAGHWVGAGVRHAGRGSWVAVPPPHRAGGRLEWIVPPNGTGALHAPDRLEGALCEANRALAVVAPVGEEWGTAATGSGSSRCPAAMAHESPSAEAAKETHCVSVCSGRYTLVG